MTGLDTARITTVLFDVDGNLFDSEPVALEASVPVTDRFAEAVGMTERFSPDSLRVATTGRNFRALATEFAAGTGRWSKPTRGVGEEELDRWVDEENRVVSEHLRHRLRPDPAVQAAVERIADRFGVAAVSSSSIARLQACFAATGLNRFFPAERCFSAEDSLDPPVSKPDPAVYLEALRRLGLRAEQSVAIEDSARGAQAAVAAGCPTIGNLAFVEPRDRTQREAELLAVGVTAVAASWAEIVDLLDLDPLPATSDRGPRAAAPAHPDGHRRPPAPINGQEYR
jgi:HAD superfamily hydrolase (TIGR01509 family)